MNRAGGTEKKTRTHYFLHQDLHLLYTQLRMALCVHITRTAPLICSEEQTTRAAAEIASFSVGARMGAGTRGQALIDVYV